jgi:hypothetical protein
VWVPLRFIILRKIGMADWAADDCKTSKGCVDFFTSESVLSRVESSDIVFV